MFLMSKDKVVIETVVTSAGVPYCDTFDVRLKKVILSSGESKPYILYRCCESDQLSACEFHPKCNDKVNH